MRLTEFTDYTLRVLMYCAANPERLITIAEVAERHAVSKNHLMKVVNELSRQGMLETTRGRGGGTAGDDVNIEAARGEAFGEICEELGRGGLVGPIETVDEKNARHGIIFGGRFPGRSSVRSGP